MAQSAGANDLLSLIAHELTQPLSAARGSALTLVARSKDPKFASADQSLLLEVVTRNLDQLQSLITSLRVFSEVESGDWTLNTKPVPVRLLLDEATEDFAQERTDRRLEVLCDADFDVNVDVTLFRQVLSNLISNAMKFSPPGSVIKLIVRSERRDLVITVDDAGPGVPKGQRERIFEKAVRLDSGKRGFGFGLYVARAIVRAHGGRLSVEPSSRGGAAFTVALPHAN